MARIFVVEDNPLIREAVAGYFKMEEHSVTEFAKIGDVLEAVKFGLPDLFVLDVVLEDGYGFSLAKKLKAEFDVPILFLSARGEESHRIMGFEAGGDDYVVKPFSPRELILRAGSLLKRFEKKEPEAGTTWSLGAQTLSVDVRSHQTRLNDAELRLTGAEWRILVYLIEHAGALVSREQILGECLNYYSDGSEKTVNTHIANLRKKLGDGEWVETVRSFGYRFMGKAS